MMNMNSDYEVGFGKPPMHTRYSPGHCPNPKGRGAGKKRSEKGALRDMLNTGVHYMANGKRRMASRREMLVRSCVADALKSDVSAALELLKMRSYFEEMTPDNVEIVIFKGGPGPRSRKLMKVNILTSLE